MQDYKYISIPISYLESMHISKKSFMQNSDETKKLLNTYLNSLPPYTELKNTFLINSSFILAFRKKAKYNI